MCLDFGYEKFAKKVGHLRPRKVQKQLENCSDNKRITEPFTPGLHRLRNASSLDMSAAEQNPDHAGEQ